MAPRTPAKKRIPTALAPALKLITVRRNGQLTLPADIRRGARIEPGDLVVAEVIEDGVVLRPRKLVDPAQAYFGTRRWQRGEREAQRDIASGRVRRFGSVEEAIAALKK
jgi:AbrB family looped-hinge helix DNA binding protein